MVTIPEKSNTRNNFTENLNSARAKLDKAFNSPKFEDLTLTYQETIALYCYLISLEGQNERLAETNSQLETALFI